MRRGWLHRGGSHGRFTLARRVLLWLTCALALSPATVFAADWLNADEPEFLKVDQAFVLSAEVDAAGNVVANWVMPDGYYLYKHQFDFAVRPDSGASLGPADIPPGKTKFDDYFGEVEVYYHDVSIAVPIQQAAAGTMEVGISYQGCADAGLCYPPETRWVPLAVNQTVAIPGAIGGEGGGTSGGLGIGAASGSVTANAGMAAAPVLGAEQAIAAELATGTLLTSLLLFFLAGVGLAFTPCVLPMVPILSSIIVGDAGNTTRARAFGLSVAYVLGMAITYAALGVVVGLFGASMNLQAALQSPTVLIFFAAVFVALSFSMFGFYELQLPQSWQNGLNTIGQRAGGGKHLSVFVMGALSALVVSPCVSAPLAGALIYLSTSEDALMGGAALLSLGLGMGVPLLIIGATGGHFLPKAGVWMNAVKSVFGVLLLAVAVWLLERVLPAPAVLALWAMLAIGCGVYLGALDFSPRQGWGQLWKTSGAISLVYGVLLLIGAASGAHDPLRPLGNVGGMQVAGGSGAAQAGHLEWVAVSNLADVERELSVARAQGVPVVLDMYADWCISCKLMERNVFPAPTVASKLNQFHRLRADVTDNNDEHKALLERFDLFGPPSLVFFASNERELKDLRIQGEKGIEDFAAHLSRVLDRASQGPEAVGELAANDH